MKIVDLSVTIEPELTVDPPNMIAHFSYITHASPAGLSSLQRYFPTLTREDLPDGMGCANETVTLSPHTGTHMDVPWHYHPTMNHGQASWTAEQVPLEWCMGNGVVVDFSDKSDGYVCTSEDFLSYFKKINYTLSPGDIVLIYTGAMKRWGDDAYRLAGCGVGREGTLWLCSQGVHTVGTDAWSWDAPLPLVAKRFEATGDASIVWEGHKAGRECAYLQMEKLDHLDLLPAFGFKVIALPIKLKGCSAGWVRAVAVVD